MSLLDEALRVRREADCLHDASAVQAAFDRLAWQIDAAYAGSDPLLLCVMNGGLYATSEIARRLEFPFQQDYLHATRYRGATEGGGLVWKRQPDAQLIAGRRVLVIDDILDEGHTLVAIRRALQEFRPASLEVAVLAEKLDVSRQSVNAIETGRYDPSLPLAFSIARLFGVPIEEIFDGHGDSRR